MQTPVRSTVWVIFFLNQGIDSLFGKMDMLIFLISMSYGKKRCLFLFVMKSNIFADNYQKLSRSCVIAADCIFDARVFASPNNYS